MPAYVDMTEEEKAKCIQANNEMLARYRRRVRRLDRWDRFCSFSSFTCQLIGWMVLLAAVSVLFGPLLQIALHGPK